MTQTAKDKFRADVVTELAALINNRNRHPEVETLKLAATRIVTARGAGAQLKKLAESFQQTGKDYREMLNDCASTISMMLGNHAPKIDGEEPCVCGYCDEGRKTLERLEEKGIPEEHVSRGRCPNCRRELDPEDPYCKCDAQAEKAGE